MTTVHHLPTAEGSEFIELDGDRITISGFTVDDAGLAELLGSQPPDQWVEVVRRALAVGARGLLSMGIGIDLAAIDGRVRQTLTAVTAEAEARVEALLGESREAFATHLDPELRSSMLGRALADFAAWRDSVLDRLDPDRADSHTAAFLDRLTAVVGPDGALEQRLAQALDPAADGSVLARIDTTIDERFTELRDLIVREEGRRSGRDEEAQRGTAQGLDFEDQVEERLRSLSGGLSGCTVERTSRTAGALGPNANVGDFVVTTGGGERIVVEAKNQATLGLTGRDGILLELDRAMANRDAGIGICISARDAFPAEVGAFGVYGSRVLVVDDDGGTMTAVAMRWALAALASHREASTSEVDLGMVAERVERIRTVAERFRATRRSLTDIGKSVESVRDTLADMRGDLLDLVGDVERAIGGAR